MPSAPGVAHRRPGRDIRPGTAGVTRRLPPGGICYLYDRYQNVYGQR